MKRNWCVYSKVLIWVTIALVIVLSPLVAVQNTHAASLGFTTMGWNISKWSWQEGNVGTWPEGQFIGSMVKISNTSSKPITLSEIDLRYSFFDGSKNIGIDYARRFYYSTTKSFAAGNTTQFPYNPSTLDPIAGWNKFPDNEPYIWNMPWIGTIGNYATSENQNAPALDHFWGINPSNLLPGGNLSAGQSLTIYFEPHLSLSFVWQNGKEGLLPISGKVGNTTIIDRSNWTAPYSGSGFFPGSKMHGNLECAVTGQKTLPVPAVSQVNGSISGYKVNDANWNGQKDTAETGIPTWPITLSTLVDSISIQITKNTGSGGSYSFTSLPDGNFTIAEGSPPSGYETYSPSPGTSTAITLTLPLGNGTIYGTPGSRTAANVNFFNHGKGTPIVTTNLSASAITLGNSVTDTATATGMAGVVPTGNVTFEVKFDGGNWTIFDTKTLSAAGQATSTSYTPSAAGTHYFKGVYSGDNNYFGAESGNTAEVLTVNKANSTTTTELSSSTIKLGQSITDTARVYIASAGSGFPNLSGNVTFYVSNDNGSNWATFGTVKSVNGGNGTSAISDSYQPGIPGNYLFKAVYSGDNNYNGSESTANTEPLTVNKADTATVTNLSANEINIGGNITDTATVYIISAGNGFPNLSGNVTFYVSNDNSNSWTTFGTVKQVSDGNGTSVTSDTYTPEIPGNYLFKAIYSGDSNYNGSESTTSLTVINRPPVAVIQFSPQQPMQGDTIKFSGNSSYDPDPGDAIVSWQWTIKRSGDQTVVASGNSTNALFISPDGDSFIVELAVTDKYGGSGGNTTSLIVGNAPPKAKALNIEVLPGKEATLIGRFIDPGWLDTHTATWFLDGFSAPQAQVQETHVPLMGTGIVTGNITVPLGTAPGNITGTLTVTDNNGGVASVQFTVTVIADDLSRHEPNNTIGNATKLASESIIQSYIQSPGDIDLFEVTLPDGEPLPAGSELLVTLKDLPADYDLVILSQQPSDVQTAGWMNTGWMNTGWMNTGWMNTGWMNTGWMNTGWMNTGWMNTNATFNQYPLSQIGFTGLDGNHIGGTDIDLGELGLSTVGDGNLTALGFSSNRGLGNETLLVRSTFEGERLFIAVLGWNEAFGITPYVLQVETSQPFDISEWLSINGITYPAPVNSWDTSTTTTPIYTYSGDALTLFVTQQERLIGLYGQDEWDTLLGNLTSLAEDGAVRGDIISVPINIYEAWDTHPYSVDEANGVASAIHDIIQEQLDTHQYQYVVIVGDDDIIPYYRAPDETLIGNERSYASDSFLHPASPLMSSLRGGFILTDDYYVSQQSASAQGQPLYVPELPVSRLVETPAEISAIAAAFLASNGILDPQTALVTGYDFFEDGAQAVADSLALALGGTNVHQLIGSSWTANDLRDLFLGEHLDISNINAHFTHYAALSAYGFTNEIGDIFSSNEVGNATGDPLQNSIVFSIGCHAGFNVPDRAAPSGEEVGPGINPQLDFAQAMAEQRATYIANTGFGIGDDEGRSGNELLIGVFAEDLLQGGTTVGDALVTAKQDYLSSLSTLTEYDAKSSMQFTLYGLPQYSVGAGAAAAQLMLSQMTSSSSTPADPLSLTVTDGTNTDTTSHSMQRFDTSSGSYFAADEDNNTQNTAFRAVQPKVVVDLALDQTNPVHGVLLQSGSFTDFPNFNAVITLPTTEWVLTPEEIQLGVPVFWPVELGTVNTLQTDGQITKQTLVVIPGQFRPTGMENGNVTGIERLYNNLSFELLRSNTSDYLPPLVTSIDLRLADIGDLAVTIEASDLSGIARIVVSSIRNGLLIPTTLLLDDLPTSGTFTINVPGSTTADRLLVQVIDDAGNVQILTAKGVYMKPIQLTAGPDHGYCSNQPVSFTTTVYDFSNLTPPVFYIWDFGDGTSVSGLTSNATFTVTHTYSDDLTSHTATVKVTDADGGIGVDDVVVQPQVDPPGDESDAPNPSADLIKGCITNDTNTMTITLIASGDISPNIQYRVKLYFGGNVKQLRYDDGKVTGLPSLQGIILPAMPNILQLSFSLADLGVSSGDYIQWSAETQNGVKATKTSGILDNMPDSGTFGYVVH